MKKKSEELTQMLKNQMTRAEALQILELTGWPSPKEYDKKAMARHNFSMDSKDFSAMVAAHSRLIKDHQAAVDEMLRIINERYDHFQSALDLLIDQSPTYKKTMKDIGKKAVKLNRDYCAQLLINSADLQQLESNYNDNFVALQAEVSEEMPKAFGNELAKLKAEITVAYEHVLEQSSEVDFQNIEVNTFSDFEVAFNYYLADILAIVNLEQQTPLPDNAPLLPPARYQKDLQILHDTLKNIGRQYFKDISAERPQITQLQDQFRRDFKQAVTTAQKAFAKEPGIWTNLDCLLKIIFGITIIPLLFIILCMEKTEDRNRLFQGAPAGEMNINKVWRERNMDVFPDPDERAPKRSMHRD